VVGEQGSQIFVRASGETFIRTFTGLIERQTQVGKRKGILISTLWSANALSRRLSLTKLSKGSLKVIDTVSMQLGSPVPAMDDVIFLNAPVALESIMAELERVISDTKGVYTFLVIDCLDIFSDRFTYSQQSRFFNYVLNRMLEEDITVVVFDHSAEESRIAKEISSLMDHRIDMVKEGI